MEDGYSLLGTSLLQSALNHLKENKELLYILARVRVLRTSNAGQNMLFQSFLCKKIKKEEKIRTLIFLPFSTF